jgi:hypothetical protein
MKYRVDFGEIFMIPTSLQDVLYLCVALYCVVLSCAVLCCCSCRVVVLCCCPAGNMPVTANYLRVEGMRVES